MASDPFSNNSLFGVFINFRCFNHLNYDHFRQFDLRAGIFRPNILITNIASEWIFIKLFTHFRTIWGKEKGRGSKDWNQRPATRSLDLEMIDCEGSLAEVLLLENRILFGGFSLPPKTKVASFRLIFPSIRLTATELCTKQTRAANRKKLNQFHFWQKF